MKHYVCVYKDECLSTMTVHACHQDQIMGKYGKASSAKFYHFRYSTEERPPEMGIRLSLCGNEYTVLGSRI